MPQEAELRVEGYQDLLRAFKQADRGQQREMRSTLREVGGAVRVDAARRIEPINARTAAGYRVVVRQRGISVEQSLRKTTGAHPEWGAYQMRHALIPALDANEAETGRRMEHALDKVAAEFNRGGVVI